MYSTFSRPSAMAENTASVSASVLPLVSAPASTPASRSARTWSRISAISGEMTTVRDGHDVDATYDEHDIAVTGAEHEAAGVKAVFTPTDNTIMTAELSIYESFIEAGVQHYTGADSFALNGALVGYGVTGNQGTAVAEGSF